MQATLHVFFNARLETVWELILPDGFEQKWCVIMKSSTIQQLVRVLHDSNVFFGFKRFMLARAGISIGTDVKIYQGVRISLLCGSAVGNNVSLSGSRHRGQRGC
jgi:hypothetical protein